MRFPGCLRLVVPVVSATGMAAAVATSSPSAPPSPAAPASSAAAAGAPPGTASVQVAYDAARQVNAERHAYDLVIETARCMAMKGGPTYACQIDFVRKAEPDRRLYFDVVTIAEQEGRWVLLSGLCVKRNGPTIR